MLLQALAAAAVIAKDNEIRSKAAALDAAEKKLKQARSQLSAANKKAAASDQYARQLQKDVDLADESRATYALNLLEREKELVEARLDIEHRERMILELQKKVDAVRASVGLADGSVNAAAAGGSSEPDD